ncbi:MAG: hypothetical protein QFX35_05135 [Candidatus Verstraetearchaeota archaeon]|nr:hypothetical protein [Candidatus Verstraetearchaeota archaeon]
MKVVIVATGIGGGLCRLENLGDVLQSELFIYKMSNGEKGAGKQFSFRKMI